MAETLFDPGDAPDGAPGMTAEGAAVVPLHAAQPARYTDAVEAYLTAAGISASSKRIYRISLTTWAWLIFGTQPPPGRRRRGAHVPQVSLADLQAPGAAGILAEAFNLRAQLADADTVNRELSVLRAAITWWQSRGWLTTDPTTALVRRPAPPDRTRALSRDQIAALFAARAPLREKTLWKLLYESCARAEEVLTRNIEDLLLADKRAKVISKGGATEWIHWQSGTAQLLPRLLAGRTRGPVFLTDRRAPARTPTLDVCPLTRKGRLSYRRAAELFEQHTRPLANPDIPAGELAAHPDRYDAWTLHQLRHAALTHEAEDGTNTPTLLQRSRHASVRSLERYSRPGVDAVARHVAARDPHARRKTT